MFGRKLKPQVDPMELRAREYQGELCRLSVSLRNAVTDVLVKDLASSVYPYGSPDRKKADEDIKAAKERVLCYVGHYDTEVAEYKRFLGKYGKPEWDCVEPATSHRWVEIAVADFFKKN